MKIEHIALQVADPVALARWYVHHLGMRIKRAQSEPPFGHFLADDGDSVMLEFYNNPTLPVPAYGTMNSLAFHLAFLAEDVDAAVDRLVSAGAVAEGAVKLNDTGDRIGMVRDPWGIPVQLVSRVTAML
jgi:catechol 2,3-dioxygenase-like lactoylglutathione lyase family enzyme